MGMCGVGVYVGGIVGGTGVGVAVGTGEIRRGPLRVRHHRRLRCIHVGRSRVCGITGRFPEFQGRLG